jgi:predicted nucleic acid-binding protein
VTICVLHTDVLIAALDRADAHHAAARDAFGRFASMGTELVICTVNYAEALVRPAEDERTLRAAVDAIATAERLGAELASFDRRVRRALGEVEPRLSAALSV